MSSLFATPAIDDRLRVERCRLLSQMLHSFRSEVWDDGSVRHALFLAEGRAATRAWSVSLDSRSGEIFVGSASFTLGRPVPTVEAHRYDVLRALPKAPATARDRAFLGLDDGAPIGLRNQILSIITEGAVHDGGFPTPSLAYPVLPMPRDPWTRRALVRLGLRIALEGGLSCPRAWRTPPWRRGMGETPVACYVEKRYDTLGYQEIAGRIEGSLHNALDPVRAALRAARAEEPEGEHGRLAA